MNVTIGVTCKNNKNTIKQCIDSLLNLNYPKSAYKIFIIDAFSNDGTYEILKSYGRKIRLEQVEGNIATGHNFIIKNSFTDLIALTDSDCVADKDWLKNLVEPFNNKKINATAGIMKTPKDVNKLQELIGKELEERFKNFPEFLPRAPTANLCLRTKLAKEILFDETLDVAQETKFGFQFTQKYGLMKYVPSAIVYHYHRATWKSFFKQQYKYGKFVPKFYLKYRDKMKGDPISTGNMAASVLYMYLFLLSLGLMLLINLDWRISLFFATIIFSIYLMDIIKITKNLNDIIYLFAVFFIRNIAWCTGILDGILR